MKKILTKTYSFRGIPDVARIVRENPTAEAIHVSAGGSWSVLLVKDADDLCDSEFGENRVASNRYVTINDMAVRGVPAYEITVDAYFHEQDSNERMQTIPAGWRGYTGTDPHLLIQHYQRWKQRAKLARCHVQIF
jgi:hypothetical protein